ncbi:regulator of chromosome condensation (RCC1) repeat-containing protein [Toxoplasma gondii ME49]|uniref:Regulator of chromosome condensation (RCC1) repeat-containing protein n=5 Tax=Toxoplasma gondii TaxID=5811 RepID=A0A125YXS4_TOXGV|nr:regulator of chromosome condensation (RCC1) repeat-containing protein [Toxoplasma gondii ME49]EPT25903.1 regulator of chromosome condensation (RCC1) repeat-containing protein [Toxoplasma gondii ME49]ESS35129.1 regulator of chromosome condensation (RCC1) repeat-containing protein [Toxoplasma gondii VEG]KYF48421.1 regulator of chromosome condensation (RCC1) repeat-containing protein [Toxoplasma gondii ARI]CEL77599.1 TPA: regulator of chromosome condensation (RCC1) repeat-containing protein [To|eukprot:XP_018635416.1 regulator of chromosome condensation (RCC1) repeat-containing protein [Toxoplasma gondii ME49]
MRRLHPFAKRRTVEDEKAVTQEFTAVLSTDSLVRDLPFRDTRTLIFIYGKPLIAHPDPVETAVRAAAENGPSSAFGVSTPFGGREACEGRGAALSGRHSAAGAAGAFATHSLNFHLPGGIASGGERDGALPFPGLSAPSARPSGHSGRTGDASPLQPVVISALANVRVVEVCVGEQHALFLSDAGEVFAYGQGIYGQLGLGYERQVVHLPQKVEGALSRFPVRQIACGDYHSVAVTREGAVFAWGAADCVGDGSGLCRFAPVRLSLGASPGDACRVIAARFQQTAAVSESGRLLVWGETFFADFHATPEVLCVFFRPVVQVAIGKHFGLVLTDDGQVYGWGDGTYGELTTAGPMAPKTLPEPLILKDSSGQSLPPVVEIATGTRHAILLTHDMRLWALGDNLAGQCGVPGHQTRLSVPKMVKLGELRSRASKIACGYRHSACITPNNQLYLWGHSSNHKLIFTAAAEGICEKASQPGVAIRSGLKSACCRARLIYSMLNMKITGAALGSETTVIVTGDGDFERQRQARASAHASKELSPRRRQQEEQMEAKVITTADMAMRSSSKSTERKTSPVRSEESMKRPCSLSQEEAKGDTFSRSPSTLGRDRGISAEGREAGETKADEKLNEETGSELQGVEEAGGTQTEREEKTEREGEGKGREESPTAGGDEDE